MAKILVTGGAGYIGSHTVLELLKCGYEVYVVDNLSNSSKEAIKRVEHLANKKIGFSKIDLRNKQALEKVFYKEDLDAVIHFAGFKAVGESVTKPLEYYDNNIVSTLILCELMAEHNIKKLIFSSSATVYGNPSSVPITEEFPIQPTNPYGQTKAVIEQVLKDLTKSETGWQINILRYFNPIGADESGLIGEDPKDIPNNLMPYITQIAVGKLKQLSVFGDDYNTPDGTGVRDYIHVTDLAKGHIAALEHLPPINTWQAYNLGTGSGTSVLETIQLFEKASGRSIPYKIVERRPGDVAECYANVEKAHQKLHWKAEKTVLDACRDSWRWQFSNANGYDQPDIMVKK
jgi:UDP-glucose 4-epimerase